ncbi:hypothetical protein [Methylobacterium oxalidis]|uniref:hypothetical protein n=1 Tax=Methylobacterium oxalidis TaxID=944322 RepID=UPI0038B40F75
MATKDVEFSSAVHAPLQQLEASGLPFFLAAAPRQFEASTHRGTILIKAGG